jgi:Carboxypeptidase regulatory-like domain/TonB dependent receptor
MNIKRICLALLPVLLLATTSVFAQTTTGTIVGTIADPSGAIVSGATVTATNVATNIKTTATTNGAGDYSIRFLPIGNYAVTVTAPGFEISSYGPFSLEIDQTAKIDLKLSVGAANTTVKVSEQEQPILNTENATLGETFTENTINSIPLNGRDFAQLTVFTPGAVSTGFNEYGGAMSTERATDAGTEPDVNGSRQQSNNFLLDGQEINENLNNTIGYNPSPDALAQMRVIGSNANAEFGNVNGGEVLMVMKSGTNRFHGSAFAFLQNQTLDANSWGNDNNVVPVPKNPYTQTLFGGTFGGPIKKDKLFFFIDFAATRRHAGGQTTASLAPAAFRAGDMSALEGGPAPLQLYDSQTVGTNGQPIPYTGDIIPANQITNPVALYLFSNPKAYPLPNHATADPYGIHNNFIGPTGTFNVNNQGDAKIDWHLRDSDIFMFRYSQGDAYDGQSADPLPVQFPTASEYPDHFFDSNWTRTFSSSIVNLFTASYGRIRFNSGVTTDPSGIFGLQGNSLVGIPSKPQQAAGFSTQTFSGSGANGYPDGFGANPTPEIFIDNVFGYTDNLTWQHGRHLLKFGFNFIRYQQNSFYPGNDGELGSFTYTGQYTSNPFVTTGAPGYSYADFLLDRVNFVAIGDVTGRTGQRQWRDGIFAQDDFKVTPNLTLNIGLRWEFDQPWYEVNNKEANIDPVTKQIQYAGVNGASRALYNAYWAQFEPRFGFAWQPKDRWVIRGGYGISSYLEGTGANLRLVQNPPFHEDFEEKGQSPVKNPDGTYNPGNFYLASNGFPTSVPSPTVFYVWAPHLKPASTQEINLTAEYQVTHASSLQAGYVGILGHHLVDPQFVNQLPAAGAPAPYVNIVGQSGTVKNTGSDAASNYNALQIVYRLRPTAGLELTANYTYSKSLANSNGYYGISNINSSQYYQQDAYNWAPEWGPAGFDTRHAVSVTGEYDLPFGRGMKYGANSNVIVNGVLGGWKLSGSDVYYSGFPVTVSSPANYSNLVYAFSGAARPNQNLPLKVVNRSINAYYGTQVQGTSCGPNQNNGTCVYSQQPDDAFGSLRPGTLRAPSFQNIDMAVSKTFNLFHENQVDFRADIFNTFNIASYSQPDSGMTDLNFGQITGVVSNPRSVQLSLKYLF